MSLQAPTASFPAQDITACPYCGAGSLAGRPFCSSCGQPGTALAAGVKLRAFYTIEEVLHSEGTGAVYRAMDSRHKRQVAIKELLAPPGCTAQERTAFQTALTRELRRFTALKQPNLPAVFETFAHEGRQYVVMEFVPGPDLRTVIETARQGLPEAQVRGYAGQLLQLLESCEAAHPPVVHGEITPAHLLLRANGTPVLTGFGLSWRLGLRARTVPPEIGLLAASTDAQAAPPVTPQDDLYGLATTLHALLTGRDVAYAASSPVPFPPVRDFAPRVSVGTAEVINRALMPDSSTRFGTASAMRAALTPVFAAPVHAIAPPRRGRAARLVGFGIVLAILVLAAALATYIQRTAAPGNPSAVVPGGASVAVGLSRTAAVSDTFMAPATSWPLAAPLVAVTNHELRVANTGTRPVQVLHSAYSTGADGFTLSATLRLTGGAANAFYGIVALDQPGPVWDNVALVVRADGRWALLRYHHGHAPALAGWATSTAVRQGHNTPNDLALTLIPGGPGQSATFSAVINGRMVASGIPAWGKVLTGRVGLLAGPDAAISADSVAVAPPGQSQVAIQDHFFANTLGWSIVGSAASPLHAGLLHASSAAPGASQLVMAHSVAFPPFPTTITAAMNVSLHARTGTGQAAGVVFAQPARGVAAPSLAAVVTSHGDAGVFAISSHGVITVAGPRPSGAVRAGAAPNMITVRTTFTAHGLVAVVSINGVPSLTYHGTDAREQPAAGLAVFGNAAAGASALRLSGQGIQLQ